MTREQILIKRIQMLKMEGIKMNADCKANVISIQCWGRKIFSDNDFIRLCNRQQRIVKIINALEIEIGTI